MNSPIKWIGGKRNLAKRILEIIPEHKTYVEPFFGAGWIFFKKEKAKVEIINDINGELINFYKVIKNNPDEFCSEFDLLPKSRELFNEFVSLDLEKATDLQRAVRLYYILMLNFGGRFNRFTFSPRNDGIKQLNYEKLPDTIKKANMRIQDAYIENQDYKKIISKWNKKDTLFFIDPPYLNTTEQDYEEEWDLSKYIELKDLLENVEGKFILTIKDVPELRSLFGCFNVATEDVFYSVSKEQKRDHKELIITNF